MGNTCDSEKVRQSQHSMQKQIQDQNYSNNILMSVYSTLEAISLHIHKQEAKKDSKRFGSYDIVQFHDKNLEELLLQFQTLLTVFHASMKGIKSDHKEGFVFPQNFPKERAMKELDKFEDLCKKQPTVTIFCRDLRSIINGKLTGLSFDKVQISVQSKRKTQGSVLQHGIHAQDEMEKRSKEVEKMNLKNPESLTVNIKQKNSPPDSGEETSSKSWGGWFWGSKD